MDYIKNESYSTLNGPMTLASKLLKAVIISSSHQIQRNTGMTFSKNHSDEYRLQSD